MKGEKFAMSQQKKPKPPTIKGKRDGHNKRRVTLDNHPSQMSGMFKDDPTFEEFREILRQQREEDLRLANEEIDATIRKEEEAKGCSSSIPTPSRTTKTGTQSSPQK